MLPWELEVHICKRVNAFNERSPKGPGGCSRARDSHTVLFIIKSNPNYHPSEHPLVGGEKVRGNRTSTPIASMSHSGLPQATVGAYAWNK